MPSELPSETKDQRRTSHHHRCSPIAFGFAEIRLVSFAPSPVWFASFDPDRRVIPPKTSTNDTTGHSTSA